MIKYHHDDIYLRRELKPKMNKVTSLSQRHALQNHKLSSDTFFSVESDGEGPRSKFDWEDGQTDCKKTARATVCGVSGATLLSCMVTRAIWNVHDQPESFCRQSAIPNLLHLVEFKTSPQPRILYLFPAKQKTTWLSSLKLCEKNNAENEKLKDFLQRMDIWEYFSIIKFVRHFQYENEKTCEKSHVPAWERWREKG